MLYSVHGRLHVNHQLYHRAERAIRFLEIALDSEDANFDDRLQTACQKSNQTAEGSALDSALSRLAHSEERLESARDKLVHWRCKIEDSQPDCKRNATKTHRQLCRDMARHWRAQRIDKHLLPRAVEHLDELLEHRSDGSFFKRLQAIVSSRAVWRTSRPESSSLSRRVRLAAVDFERPRPDWTLPGRPSRRATEWPVCAAW
jgi:hypothetical protein